MTFNKYTYLKANLTAITSNQQWDDTLFGVSRDPFVSDVNTAG